MKRLLVVDDNSDILEILQIAFQANGFEVYQLADGEKVLETVEQFSPDIILLDVFLGSTNGTIICSELKSKPQTKHIPVIMFSAHSNAETVLKSCPADDFVAKPFSIHKMIQVIESHLDKNA